MPGGEGAGRALAVDVEPARCTLHQMLLHLTGVVGDVEEKRQGGLGKEPREDASRDGTDDLPVGERTVDRSPHSAQVARAHRRVDRRAGQLPVDKGDAMLGRGDDHVAQELGADLVPETARAAMHADHDLALGEPEGGGRGGVVNSGDVLDLQIVVARSQSAHLPPLPFLGVLGHVIRPGAGHLAAFLDPRQIRRGAVAAIQRPGRTAGEHGVHLRRVEAEWAVAADPGGNLILEGVGELGLLALDLFTQEAGQMAAHAAGDVETHTAGRDHAAFRRVEGGDPADRKAITPMGVGHGVGRGDDTGQTGDVRHLLADLLVHSLDQVTVGIDDAGNAHGAVLRDMPLGLADGFQVG